MDHDRRAAPRHSVPSDLVARVGGAEVRIIDLSLVGAKAEHSQRFPLDSPQLRLDWQGHSVTLSVRIARSEIVGRRNEAPIYQTGLHFVNADAAAEGFIAALLREPLPSSRTPGTAQSRTGRNTGEEQRSADDTSTRQARLLPSELDDDLPYAQFRLTNTGWKKDYVESTAQPDDGFTIARERRDFHELQRTFEIADAETRRMMQLALESELLA